MTAPPTVATDEGGFWASLGWRLGKHGFSLGEHPAADARRLTPKNV